MDAFEELMKQESRNPALPEFADIGKAAETALSASRGPAEVIAVLEAIEKKLTEQLPSATHNDEQALHRHTSAPRRGQQPVRAVPKGNLDLRVSP